ncbi:carboxylating nicotinate-nucleotide diphosphorylase [Gottfriedia acidiceleris]|uniref:carboxylating nicotinate-nucleotide diphosphorylase n=1 Tax=Bacillaceae TaxID=186817 RepID=UPI000BEB79BC|nr:MULTISPECIES: carboxylating nicotinate-nucleotide diphosphorylase [unclassified Bacillus (in: firmicutes)]PEC47504.1 nicotinate-nucleotide diphosphorylase (carboxylating) [Bacillus sp. AFS096315]PFM75857.1 nicotinate-nucleotide diphosphorylase (carboxylating) [Bacillus sp. AFS077874]
MNTLKAKKMIEQFLLEDIGEGDLSSIHIFPMHERTTGKVLAKADGVIAGTDLIEITYKLLHENIKVTLHVKDGETVQAGQLLAEVEGPVQVLLSGERVMLNLLQRMSGIATLTSKAVETLNDEKIKLVDTRKTMPGLRLFDKYAVTCGGGSNHRFGLYDAVMLKDNHIAYAGSIKNAVDSLRNKLGHMVKIEVETENKDQVLQAIEAGADVIMFDNRTPDEIKEFVKLVPETIVTEASGGITLDNLANFQNCGVNVISLGCLTHSAKALDISFYL